MFVEDNDRIEMKIYYRKVGRNYDALTENDFKKVKEELKGKYKILIIEMKVLTWGMFNDLQELAMVESGDGMGGRNFNFKVYKENRLKRLLVKWDAKDKDGKAALINDKTINQLAPPIAEAILKSYDEASFLGEEEEKN
jgi:hypothetical protein